MPTTRADARAQQRSGGRRLVDAALTVASIGGVICILLVIAATIFHVTLIMFKTGSMSPTIPAGSVAVVREIPAAEARVGDVLTIARPGELPITHRVTSVTPLEGNLTSITMKGDANDFEDPAPYTVSTARIVMYSVPGLAAAIVAVSHPLALGGITLGAALLVTWAFWPRGHARPRAAADRSSAEADQSSTAADQSSAVADQTATAIAIAIAATERAPHGRRRQQRDDDGHGHSPGAGAAGVAALVLALALAPAVFGPAPSAHAADSDDDAETMVAGRYLTLVSIHDPNEMSSLAPGRPVPWQVGVTVDAPEPGTVHIGISADGELTDPGELSLDVRACSERWVDGVCASGESVWLPRQDLAEAVLPVPSSMDNPEGAREIGEMRAPTRWLMLRVVMPESFEPGSGASLRLHAWGSGDEVAVDGADSDVGAASGAGTGADVGTGASFASDSDSDSDSDSSSAPGFQYGFTPARLALTGFSAEFPLALAITAVGSGLALAASARLTRRTRA